MLDSIGQVHLAMGDLTAALTHLHEALQQIRQAGNVPAEAANIATVHLSRGDLAVATSWLGQAADAHRRSQDRHREGISLRRLSQAHLDRGEPAVARRQLQAAMALRLTVPDPDEQQALDRLARLLRLGGEPSLSG